MMSPAQLDRIKRILAGVTKLPSGERPEFIRTLSGGDQAVRQEVESLLELEPAVGEFLAKVVIAGDRERIPAELRLGASAFPETGALPAKAAF